MKRCRSYKRGWMYYGKRCELEAGHAGLHFATGSFIDPHQHHRWGRKGFPKSNHNVSA
jgi:hypothetical protein